MRKQTYIIVAMIIALSAVGLSTASAQSTSSQQFTADIPFAFHVGSQRLPAGEYVVRCINPSSDVKVLQLRSSDGKSSAMLHTNSVEGRMIQDAKLVFNRSGNQYYFAQEWLVSEKVGMQAAKSRREKATAKELARLAQAPEMVAIARKR